MGTALLAAGLALPGSLPGIGTGWAAERPGPKAKESQPGARQPLGEAALAEKLRFYQSVSTLEVDFRQTKRFQEMNIEIRSEGRLRLERPDRVTWEIVRPSPLKVELDRERIRIETGAGTDRQVQEFKASDAPSERSARSLARMVAWLNLDAAALSSQYQVFETAPQSFRFVPRNPADADFKELEMKLGKSGHLTQLKLHEISGDRMSLDFGTPKITRKAGQGR